MFMMIVSMTMTSRKLYSGKYEKERKRKNRGNDTLDDF